MSRRAALPILVSAVLAGAAMIASSLLLKQTESAALRIGVALLPVPFFVAMFATIVRAARRTDEMQVRIHFEALAMTFVLTAIACVTYGQLQKAGQVPLTELSAAWLVMAFIYPLCYALSFWRYAR